MVIEFQPEPLALWHDALHRVILDQHASAPRSSLAVARGPAWSSPKALHKHPAARSLVAQFHERLHEVAGSASWDLTLWGNITHQGGAIDEHDHANGVNVWSGVYYLTGGAPIVFPAEGLILEPQPGSMLIFPAASRHEVAPQIAAAPRVSVAMNAAPAGANGGSAAPRISIAMNCRRNS